MITHEKLLRLEAFQAKLGSLFENLNNSEWLDEIRLTTKEAAAFLGISPNALRIRVHRGKIEAEKLDRDLRFKLSKLSFLNLKQLQRYCRGVSGLRNALDA